MSRRSSRKYRICTDSIAHTAGTTKRSTWSSAAKSRYDRCLRKVENNKYTNEQMAPTGSRIAQENLKKWRRGLARKPQFGAGGQRQATGIDPTVPAVPGQQVSHTVYARIGALISEKKRSTGRREGESGKSSTDRPARRPRSLRGRAYAGVRTAILGPWDLGVRGFAPLGSGGQRERPEQHREKSPGSPTT
jgi:hypothetical protein